MLHRDTASPVPNFHPGPVPSVTPATSVVAVVVTFHPDVAHLRRQFDALLPQVDRIVVVDNGSSEHRLAVVREWSASMASQLSLIELGRNQGIASAQNRGIEVALAAGASHVLLMDQDSVPAGDMVQWLLSALASCPPAAAPAAAGPRIYDPCTRTSLDYLRKSGTRYKRMSVPETTTAPLEVDHLIASGSLIPAEALARIGNMDEGLFIDAVDTEWCLRARAAGFRLIAEARAVLEHELGSHRMRLRIGGRFRTLAFHPPLRQYYIFRNNLLLCRRPYVDRAWLRLMMTVLPRRLALYCVFGPNRFEYLTEMLAGIRDALLCRTGRRP